MPYDPCYHGLLTPGRCDDVFNLSHTWLDRDVGRSGAVNLDACPLAQAITEAQAGIARKAKRAKRVRLWQYFCLPRRL